MSVSGFEGRIGGGFKSMCAPPDVKRNWHSLLSGVVVVAVVVHFNDTTAVVTVVEVVVVVVVSCEPHPRNMLECVPRGCIRCYSKWGAPFVGAQHDATRAGGWMPCCAPLFAAVRPNSTWRTGTTATSDSVQEAIRIHNVLLSVSVGAGGSSSGSTLAARAHVSHSLRMHRTVDGGNKLRMTLKSRICMRFIFLEVDDDLRFIFLEVINFVMKCTF